MDSLPESFVSYQFEVEIINGGEDDSISIGLISEISDKSPGMNPNTIGIYGFDGLICRDGEKVSSCLPFTTGDVISCTVHKNQVATTQFTITSCQFSKNDKFMGKPLNVVGKKFYPAVGLHSPGAAVQIRLNVNRNASPMGPKETTKDSSKGQNCLRTKN